jgi:ribosome biogenesis GTPase
VEGGVYRVLLENGGWAEATLRGRLKQQRRTGSQVVIGDRVEVSDQGGAWTVDRVEERASQLVRRGVGGRRAKVMAANVDRVFAVVAAKNPDASLELIDRLLVVIEASGLRATLVVNKVDLEGAAEVAAGLETLYGTVGYRVLPVSAESGHGLRGLKREVSEGTSAFVGPSGAGKSSLLNAVDPSLGLRTGALSRKTGTGRHTTVSSQLIHLSGGGLVADTPGFGDVGLWGVLPDDVERCFPDLARLAESCRFRGCGHAKEPDCAVIAAVEQGSVPESRYRSYRRLRDEATEATRPGA